jgi:hypothetical protein
MVCEVTCNWGIRSHPLGDANKYFLRTGRLRYFTRRLWAMLPNEMKARISGPLLYFYLAGDSSEAKKTTFLFAFLHRQG